MLCSDSVALLLITHDNSVEDHNTYHDNDHDDDDDDTRTIYPTQQYKNGGVKDQPSSHH